MVYNPQAGQPILSGPGALRSCYRYWWLRQQMTEAIERHFRAFTTSDESAALAAPDELPDLTSWRHTDRQEDQSCH